MHSQYLDSIRAFEGFTPRAQWDYAQHSNGYGTRALHPGEVISHAEAERRFQSEIASARAVVERHAANVDEGTKAALTSLTFNAGDRWVRDGLGDAVRRGDLEAVRSIFLEYNKAGGKVLEGLVARRVAEAQWIGSSEFDAGTTQPVAATPAGPTVVATPPGDNSSMRSLASVIGAGQHEPLAASGTGAGPLLMSLRLHMALIASGRLERSDDGGRNNDRDVGAEAIARS